METRIHDFQIAPRVDHSARGIEFDERRSESGRVQIAFVHVLAIQNEDVILRVNADSTKAAKRPPIRQWLWPREVSLVLRGTRLRVYVGADLVGADLEVGPRDDRENGRRCGDHKRSSLVV